MSENESRLVHLETYFADLENTLENLSTTVAEQWRAIDTIRRRSTFWTRG